MSYRLKTFGIALVLLLALAMVPASAHPTCPPGEIWQSAVYGPCQECPTIWIDTSHWGTCQNCPHHHETVTCEYEYCNDDGTQGTKLDHDYHLGQSISNVKVYDCHTGDPNYRHDSCSSNHEQHWIVSSVTEYDCHDHPEHPIVGDYISCDGWWHHEKQIISLAGCVAGCDCQHPCPEGQHCSDGQCVVNTCPLDFQCGQGQVCIDGGCQPASPCNLLGTWTLTYDGGWIHEMIIDQYDSGTGHVGGHGNFLSGPDAPADGTKWVLNGTLYDDTITFTIVYTEGPRRPYEITLTADMTNCQLMNGDGWNAVPFVTVVQQSGYPMCYSRGMKEYAYTCEQALTATPTQELRLTPGGAKLLFKVERAAGSMDAFIVWDPQAGEQSFAPMCNGMEWWNDHCTEFRRCGFTPLTIEVNNPHGKIRVLAVMDESSTPGAPPMTITIEDQYTREVYFSITTSDEVFDKTFVVVDDYTGCVVRPQLVGNWGDWITVVPTLTPELTV